MNSNTPFSELGLSPELLKTIEKKGFTMASEIQEKTIPLTLENKHDIIGVAQTGTGKTAAFGLPMIDMITEGTGQVKAIVLAPTRELALQVCKELESFKGDKKIKTLTVYGGASIQDQMRDLKRGVDIVVGTPGRVADMMRRKVLSLSNLEFFVLDEADEMLNMGFADEMEEILKHTPEEKRVLLFSATMPSRIKLLSKKYMRNQVVVEAEKKHDTKANITQLYFCVRRHDKLDVIKTMIDIEPAFHGIIFCQTKVMVDEVTQTLKLANYEVDCIHGDIPQNTREKILTNFRSRKINILVATDVAARGIDIDDLTHVMNYTLPREIESYVHRIGRTGRAGKKGTAITFVEPREENRVRQLAKVTKSVIEKGHMPTHAEIAALKEEKVLKNLEKILADSNTDAYATVAKNVITSFGATETVAALLFNIFGDPTPKKSAPPRNDDRGDQRQGGGGGGSFHRRSGGGGGGDRRRSGGDGERRRSGGGQGGYKSTGSGGFGGGGSSAGGQRKRRR